MFLLGVRTSIGFNFKAGIYKIFKFYRNIYSKFLEKLFFHDMQKNSEKLNVLNIFKFFPLCLCPYKSSWLDDSTEISSEISCILNQFSLRIFFPVEAVIKISEIPSHITFVCRTLLWPNLFCQSPTSLIILRFPIVNFIVCFLFKIFIENFVNVAIQMITLFLCHFIYKFVSFRFLLIFQIAMVYVEAENFF